MSNAKSLSKSMPIASNVVNNDIKGGQSLIRGTESKFLTGYKSQYSYQCCWHC